jgi:hypothetical protein
VVIVAAALAAAWLQSLTDPNASPPPGATSGAEAGLLDSEPWGASRGR